MVCIVCLIRIGIFYRFNIYLADQKTANRGSGGPLVGRKTSCREVVPLGTPWETNRGSPLPEPRSIRAYVSRGPASLGIRRGSSDDLVGWLP